MVVDDVEDHGNATAMRCVDEALRRLGTTIEARRGEEIDSVVPPPELTGKIGDRHDLDDGHAELAELAELSGGGFPRPFAGEGPQVELVDHSSPLGRAGPYGVPPGERGIDHLRRTVRPRRLEARGRVRVLTLAVEPVAIEGSRGGGRTEA